MSAVPVVAISGHPGAGKTTLTRALASHFRVPALYYDDFETITARPPAEIADWMARGSDYDEIDLAPMLVALERAAAARPRLVVIDTLLGRAHAATGAWVTLSIWLDVSPDIALARKLGAASQGVGGDAAKALDFANWIGSYAVQYERFIAETYRVQAARVRAGADVFLPPNSDPRIVVAAAVAAIESAGL